MTTPRILVLAKKSELRVHIEGRDVGRHARVEQLLRDNDQTVARMQGAHVQHEATLVEVERALVDLGCEATVVTAAKLDEFRVVEPRGHDLVVTIGGDGTLLAASHAIAETPVLAINSAPEFSVGFFCGARLGGVRASLQSALEGRLPSVRLTRMSVFKDGVLLTRRVLNEVLVCSDSPAATSRYILQHARGKTGAGRETNTVVEEQKSSGVWIGPAAGSTAAQRSAGGRVLPLTSRRLQFVVREPYTPAGGRLHLPRGLVRPGEHLELRAKMSDGRVFVDGPHEVHEVTIGEVLSFTASDEPLQLLGVVRRPDWKAHTPSRVLIRRSSRPPRAP